MTRATVGVDLRALVGSVSGIGFYTHSLLDRLAQRGWGEYIGMAHDEVEGAEDLTHAGVRLEYRSAPLGVIWQQFVLPRRLRRGDVDVFWSPLLTLPMGIEVPSVVTIHDLTPLLHPRTHTLKVRLSTVPFLRQTTANANIIVADSEATAADIRQHFPRSTEKIRVIYPGVDTAFVPGNESDIIRMRTDLGCPDGYILFAGTLEPRKNVGFLLDAWESLRARDPKAPGLVLTGGYGWRSRKLLTRIRRLEETAGLVYLERVDRERLVRIFQAASVFVLPSIYEGFGLPAAEAMACGVPTVVTNTSSLPEVVGDAGAIVEINDTQGLTNVLDRLSQDTAWGTELGAKGLQRASRFDWSRAAAEMERVFQEALR